MKRHMRSMAWLALLIATAIPVSLCAQDAGGAAPVPPPETPPITPVINRIQQDIQTIQSTAGTINQEVPTIINGVKKIADIENSYPQALADYKAAHGLPANPTMGQEVEAATSDVLVKGGMDAKEAGVVAKSLEGVPKAAQSFKVLDPTSIAMAVGLTAGMNVLGQVASGGGVDLKKALTFVAQPSFWGGVIGSSAGWTLAGLAVRALLPPGFGGILAPFLPTFASMTASILGYQIGTKGFGQGLGATLKSISIPEVLAQAAGSTVGLFVGSSVATALGASLGGFAGPLGAIIGAMLFGQLAQSIVHATINVFSGQSGGGAAASGVPNDPITNPSATLPAQSLVSINTIAKIKDDYASTYQQFVAAQNAGNSSQSKAALDRLTGLRQQYDLMMKALFSSAMQGHQSPGQ